MKQYGPWWSEDCWWIGSRKQNYVKHSIILINDTVAQIRVKKIVFEVRVCVCVCA